jgi:hypothetical protein
MRPANVYHITVCLLIRAKLTAEAVPRETAKTRAKAKAKAKAEAKAQATAEAKAQAKAKAKAKAQAKAKAKAKAKAVPASGRKRQRTENPLTWEEFVDVKDQEGMAPEPIFDEFFDDDTWADFSMAPTPIFEEFFDDDTWGDFSL